MKLGLIVAGSVVVLGSMTWYFRQTSMEARIDRMNVVHYSNDVVRTRQKLDEQQMVNLTLERQLQEEKAGAEQLKNHFAQQSADFVTLSNRLESLLARLAEAESKTLTATHDKELRESRISELEEHQKQLSQRLTQLTGQLDSVQQQLAQARLQLTAAGDDRQYLLATVHELQAKRSQLEAQFNDLAALRRQVRFRTEELAIAKRVQWTRGGVYARQQRKGAELLVKGMASNTTTNRSPEWSVELEQSNPIPARNSP